MQPQDSAEAWARQYDELQARLRSGRGVGLARPDEVTTLTGLQALQAMLAGELPYPHIAETLDFGLIEVAFGLSFTVLTMRAFVATIPREIDEAAIVDGAGALRLFFRVIFPLLRSVIVTIIVVQSIFVFNDFQNPLYFLPGDSNATVQLTLYNFQAQAGTIYNLLFANILVITVPVLVLYIIFQRQIVSGMTSGAVKG